MLRGTFNNGIPAPDTQGREQITRCCARCRRGVPGFGELPCGYNEKCKCHTKEQ